jgi:uncharacterized protein (DUF58 family)
MFSSIYSMIRSVRLTPRFFVAGAGVVVLYVTAFFVPAVGTGAHTALAVLAALVVVDGGLLYGRGDGVGARRTVPDRLSNGDENRIRVRLHNPYPFAVQCGIADEQPVQFQARDTETWLTLPPGRRRTLRYSVRPTRRGEYTFGAINVFATSPIGLVERHDRHEAEASVPVYPSFLQMRAYELMAASNRLEEMGVKPVRQLGHTMEFDHIREYVVGDDRRAVNWKASARRGQLMVNEYRDERAQPVYCVVNAGRVMEMPFEGMTLLDYSINASLALARIALMKQDRTGLVAFADEVGPVLPAQRAEGHTRAFQEQLYRLDTDFQEADYARLATYVRTHLQRRGLLVLFTNFMTRSSLERQLPYLRALKCQHTVVVVFFENPRLSAQARARAGTVEDIYVKTMAERFVREKEEVVRTLRQNGCYAVYTPPQELSTRTLNQYLTLKAQGVV